MLSAGNHKLGGRLIWSFSLPSGRPEICTGMSSLCQRHCYARRLEAIRPAMRARYQANYLLSLSPRFVRRVLAFLVCHEVAVVRLHVGGDFLCGGPHKKSCVAQTVMCCNLPRLEASLTASALRAT
jgi:hypothetical protein